MVEGVTPGANAQQGVAVDDPVIRALAERSLYIGVAAWSEPSLAELYPRTAKTAEQRLRHYATQFAVTEVDSTFYHPLAERTAALWAGRTPPGFRFDVKAFRLLTQHPTPPGELWRDLREALPAELVAKPRVYVRDMPEGLVAEVLRRFAMAVRPLQESGRLGLLLFQLPRYLYPSRVSFGYLEFVARELPGLTVGVEFRQPRWMDDEHRERTLDFLAGHGLAYVCVDEPQGLASSVPPVAAATAEIAAVRFHGRNRELWEESGVSPAQRHTYDYQAAEMAEWVPRIMSLHEGGRHVHLLMNNIGGGYAIHNARLLARMLADQLR